MEFIEKLLSTLEGALPVFLAIFVAVFFSIIIIRLIFAILLYHAARKLAKLKKIKDKFSYKKSAKYIKEDEELLRKLDEMPKAHSAVKAEMRAKQTSESNSYEIIPSKEQELSRAELNEVKIVDIVKPIGFWTSMILGQKLTYLIQSAQVINKRDNKGFWVSMIEAKEREAGKQHARGR